MKKKNLYAVILAQDASQTLWPLHRKNQDSDLVSVSPDQSLLEQALGVIESYIPFEFRYVVLSEKQDSTLSDSIKGLASVFLDQPSWKGTAPAFLHACLAIQASDPEAIVIGIPTDIYFSTPKKALEFIMHAVDHVSEHDDITLLGISPSYDSAEHSLIIYDFALTSPYHVASYKTPSEGVNKKSILGQENMLWDSGIVVVQARSFVEICNKENNVLYKAMIKYLSGECSFDDVPDCSLEDAIFKSTKKMVVLPAHFPWYSLRSLESFLAVKNHLAGEQNIVTIDAQNNLVEVQDSLVALVGVNNLCIVQSEDVLLVVSRDQLDKIKLVLEMLKQHQSKEYL